MATIKALEITDKKIWDNFILNNPDANFLQSWEWGEFHKNLGKTIHRVGFYSGSKPSGVMLTIVEDAKRGRYLTVPAGPIIDWKNKSQVSAFVSEIKNIAKLNSCIFVRVRPQLESSDYSKKLFKDLGFSSSPMHLHAELTSQIGLDKSEEEFLANMRKATRYEIKKAQNLGIKISSSEDLKDIKKFYEIQMSTSRRQKFVPFSYNFFAEQFKVFSEEGYALLYSAKLGNKLLAQAFVIFYGREAAYHYGASTDEGRKYPGAYLIQWEAIKEARRRGMKVYNLWGVSPPDDKNHRFYGISLFKRGFGGLDFEYLHAHDLIRNRPKYLINFTIETLRKKLRRV